MPAEPALSGNVRADIAIVGAGFTGLWTALFLKELSPSTEITIIEQKIAGYGGSGRNAGILGETLDHSHALAVIHFGLDEARKLASIGIRNIHEMAAFLQSEQIHCDLELSGRLSVALTSTHVEELHANMEVTEQMGVSGARLLNEAQAQEEIHCPLYKGALFVSSGGILHPIKLIEGLKKAVMKRGVKLFENTAVLNVGQCSVQAQNGNVAAEKIILATDSYSHRLFPELLRYFIPLYDYILVSEPFNDKQLEAIGWKHRQGVIDGRAFFNYYRLTADNRIVWGTSEAKYYSPNRVQESCDHSEEHYESLRKSFARHFPQLPDVKFVYAWGGPIASTTRLTPFFGTMEGGHIHYGLGYTGHGIGSTRVAGKILAHLALEKPDEVLDLAIVKKKPFPYPPEPLRKWSVEMVTSALRKVDAGQRPGFILRLLDRMGIGFSS